MRENTDFSCFIIIKNQYPSGMNKNNEVGVGLEQRKDVRDACLLICLVTIE